MPARQVVVFLGLSVLLLAVVVELVRRRRLRVEYSWLWIAACLTSMLLIVRYDLLVSLTGLVGAVVPTSTLFFLCTLYLALLSLHYSIRISHLTHQVKDLAQEMAILRAQLPGEAVSQQEAK
ncbi:MAG TPA: DUF2304 domain-containing protein [Vicinamibacteria bacterium]|nr:DUF2304 domain-containing protein [Vicinamibacteria bacterium]